MQTPKATSSVKRFVRYGRYVTSRLKRKGLNNMAASALAVTTEVLAKGREWENIDFDTQDHTARRDHADDVLDEVAQDTRRELLSRSNDAKDRTPYTQIFHEGVTYYTASSLDDHVDRYQELADRAGEFLPEDDPLRADVMSRVSEGLEDYEEAVKELRQHRVKVAIASTIVLEAKENFSRAMDRIYGQLVASDDIGRRRAERFFPRIAAQASSSKNGEEEDSES